MMLGGYGDEVVVALYVYSEEVREGEGRRRRR